MSPTPAPTRKDCASGYVCADEVCTNCTACAAGKYSSSNRLVCIGCSAGKYSNAASTSCSLCAAGKYSITVNATSIDDCQSCGAGTTSNVGSTACYQCLAGTYISGLSCIDCPVGRYAMSNGMYSCSACPKGRYASSVASQSCTLCPVGRYTTTVGNSVCDEQCPSGTRGLTSNTTDITSNGTSCVSCGIGWYQPNKGQTQCLECPQGMVCATAGLSTGTPCPQGTYNRQIGGTSETECVSCPSGRTTPTTGTTSEADCVSPDFNFVMGFFMFGFACFLAYYYIWKERFEKIAFLRKKRVTGSLIREAAAIFPKIKEEILEARAEDEVDNQKKEKENKRENFWKTLFFLLLLLGVLFFGTFSLFIINLSAIFFKALIVFRGLDLEFNFFDSMWAFVVQLCNMIYMPWMKWLAYPFIKFLGIIADIHIDLASITVTCSGAAAPLELVLNMSILGLAIIVIESDFQMYSLISHSAITTEYLSLTLTGRYRDRYYEETLKNNATDRSWLYDCLLKNVLVHIFYGLDVVTALAAEGVASVDLFQGILQYGVSLLVLSKFFSSGAHHSSASCNAIEGLENFDILLAMCSTLLAYGLLFPTMYIISKVLVPGFPRWASKKIPKRDGDESRSSIIIPARTSTGEVPTSAKDLERIDSRIRGAQDAGNYLPLCDLYCRVCGELFRRRLKWLASYLTFDMWWAWASQRMLKSLHKRKYIVDNISEELKNSHKEYENNSFYLLAEPARAMSDEEGEEWRNALNQRMPTYFSLCYYYEYQEMAGGLYASRQYSLWNAWYLFLIAMGVGHILTSVGRFYWSVVFWKYGIFFAVCFGYWNDELYELFDIEKKVDDPRGPCYSLHGKYLRDLAARDGASSNDYSKSLPWAEYFSNGVKEVRTFLADPLNWNCFRCNALSEQSSDHDDGIDTSSSSNIDMTNEQDAISGDYEQCLYALIGTRSTLLQIVPFLASVTIFTVNTASAPLFINSPRLKDKIAEFYQSPYECYSDERESQISSINLIQNRTRQLQRKSSMGSSRASASASHNSIREEYNIECYVKSSFVLLNYGRARRSKKSKFTLQGNTLQGNRLNTKDGKYIITSSTNIIKREVQDGNAFKGKIYIYNNLGENIITLVFDNENIYKKFDARLTSAKAEALKDQYDNPDVWADSHLKWVYYLKAMNTYFTSTRSLAFLQYFLRTLLSFILIFSSANKEGVVIASLIILLPFNTVQMFNLIILLGRAIDIRDDDLVTVCGSAYLFFRDLGRTCIALFSSGDTDDDIDGRPSDIAPWRASTSTGNTTTGSGNGSGDVETGAQVTISDAIPPAERTHSAPTMHETSVEMRQVLREANVVQNPMTAGIVKDRVREIERSQQNHK